MLAVSVEALYRLTNASTPMHDAFAAFAVPWILAFIRLAPLTSLTVVLVLSIISQLYQKIKRLLGSLDTRASSSVVPEAGLRTVTLMRWHEGLWTQFSAAQRLTVLVVWMIVAVGIEYLFRRLHVSTAPVVLWFLPYLRPGFSLLFLLAEMAVNTAKVRSALRASVLIAYAVASTWAV